VLTLRHKESRDYLAKHLPEITGGCRHLKQVFAIEFAEDAADAVPTAIFDNFARSKVHAPLNQRLDDFLAWLENQA
jgi:hypothetical protein